MHGLGSLASINHTNKLMKFVRLVLFCLLCSISPLLAWGQSGRYTVQIEAVLTQAEAEEKIKQLKARGVEAYWLKSDVPGAGVRYRVRVGHFAAKKAATNYGKQLRQQGLAADFFVTLYELPPAMAKQSPNEMNGAGEKSTPPAKPKEQPHSLSSPPSTSKPTTTPKPAPENNPLPSGYVRFEDKTIGYSFAHPSYWIGGALGSEETQRRKIDAGAILKSSEDAAFLTVIWNAVEGANRSTLDNDLVSGLIIQGLGAGTGTQSLTETSRRVTTEDGQIKTFVGLHALFRERPSLPPLEFLGQAVIIRATKGILLVTVFYAKDAPPQSAQVAERIVSSARAPQ